jgi:hypothetical protein
MYLGIGDREEAALAVGPDFHDCVFIISTDERGVAGSHVLAVAARPVSDVSMHGADSGAVGAWYEPKVQSLEDIIRQAELAVERREALPMAVRYPNSWYGAVLGQPGVRPRAKGEGRSNSL